jgi:hypothetical protein
MPQLLNSVKTSVDVKYVQKVISTSQRRKSIFVREAGQLLQFWEVMDLF